MSLCVVAFLAHLRACLSLEGRALAEFCAPDGSEPTRAFLQKHDVPGATNSPCMLVAVSNVDTFLRAEGCPAAELAGPLGLDRWQKFESFVKRVAPGAWTWQPRDYAPEPGDVVHVFASGTSQHWFTLAEVDGMHARSVDGTLWAGVPVVREAERLFELDFNGADVVLERFSGKRVATVVRMRLVLEALGGPS